MNAWLVIAIAGFVGAWIGFGLGVITTSLFAVASERRVRRAPWHAPRRHEGTL